MQLALGIGFLAMTLLSVVLLALRARQLSLASRVGRAEERAVAAGLTEGT